MLYFFCFSRIKGQNKKGIDNKMSRIARQKSSTKVYHVILRGNAKQDIFLEKQDYSKFIKEICHTKEKYQYELYAYCLMTNHIHLILYDKMENLSKALQGLTIRYSSYWNKKYERVGHVFQNRFLSKSVETQEYLKNLCRYIHQNPCKSGIASMEEYPWSSYQEYSKKNKIIEEKQILLLFGQDRKEAISNFIEFHKMNKAQKDIKELIEYEMIEKLKDEQAKQYIEEILNLKNLQEIREYSIAKRNQYLEKLKGVKGISKAQIARLIGLSEKMVKRAMTSK